MENKITGANAQEAFEQPFLSQLFSDIGPPSESQSITLSSSSSKPALFPSEADESREEQKGEERSTPLSMPTPLQPKPKLTQRPLGLAERVGKGGTAKGGEKRKHMGGTRSCTLCGNTGHTASSSQCDMKKKLGKKMTQKQFAHTWVLDLPTLASKPPAPLCSEPPRGVKYLVLLGRVPPHQSTENLHQQQILCSFYGDNAAALGEGLIESSHVQTWSSAGKSQTKRVFLSPTGETKQEKAEGNEEEEGGEEECHLKDQDEKEEEGDDVMEMMHMIEEEERRALKKARAAGGTAPTQQNSSAIVSSPKHAAREALHAHVRRTKHAASKHQG
jgi:hypothetical protein